MWFFVYQVLLTVSLIGTGMGLAVMGSYMYLQSIGYDLEGFKWIPLSTFSYILFIACAGLMPLPFIIISEIMPQEVRFVLNRRSNFLLRYCLVIYRYT